MRTIVAKGIESSTSIIAQLRETAITDPGRVVYHFIADGEQQSDAMTYAELDQRARAIGATLQGRIGAGERVILLLPPGPDFISAFFGCGYAGTVAVPTMPPMSVDPNDAGVQRLLRIIADSGAAALLTIKPLADLIATTGLPLPAVISVDDLPDNAHESWSAVVTRPSDLAFLQYTSGSTADPKGVMVTHGNLTANLAYMRDRVELTPASRAVIWLPPYHDMGLIGGLLMAAFVGYPAWMMNTWDFLQRPARWVETMSRVGATHCPVPNFALDLAVRKTTPEQRAALDLSGLKMLMIGAEPVRPGTLARFAEAFAVSGFNPTAFVPAYGLAEATLMVSTIALDEPVTVRGFDQNALRAGRVESGGHDLVGCGEIDAFGEIKIEAEPGGVGEIVIRGDSVSPGYWNATDEAAFVDGWVRTGDLGFIDNGQLFIAGRAKDVIIIRGANHYPQDIELTAEIPGVRPGCVAAFGVDNAEGEQLVIVAEGTTEVDVPQLVGAVSAAHGVVPKQVVIIEPRSIPKTTSGKIQRRLTRSLWLDSKLPVVTTWPAVAEPEPAVEDTVSQAVADEAEIAGWIEEQSRQILGTTKPLPLHEPVTALGVDSLDLAELVGRIETHFRAPLPVTEMPRDLSIAQLAAFVAPRVTNHQHGVAPRITAPAPAEVKPRLLPQPRAATPAVPVARLSTPFAPRAFADLPEFAETKQRLDMVTATGLPNPFFAVQERRAAGTTTIGGVEYADFTSYNYLGLSGDPEVTAAARDAIERFGTSVSASRLVSGERQIHRDLEQEIARFIGVEDAIAFVSGNLTNVGVLGTLAKPGDLIMHDAYAHDSIIRGAMLSGATRRSFPHNDADALDKMLAAVRTEYDRVWIVVEGAYSLDGDLVDLPAFIEVKEANGAFLMVDEAHSYGVVGPTGRGVSEFFGVHPGRVEIWMGTLSKTLASCGGYIAGSRRLIEHLKYNAGGFVYSVGLSPADTAAALAAQRKLAAEPERVAQLRDRYELFRALARDAGLDVGDSANSAVVPLMVGSSVKALRVSHDLRKHGIHVAPIIYPAVEEGTARLRFFICADHTEEQLRNAVTALVAELS